MKYIIAIDIGTQSTRASVINQDGTILLIEQIMHDLVRPFPNWAQQNPDSCGTKPAMLLKKF